MELFDKPLKDLTVADLKHRLQDEQVREGFFVDYKVKVNDELWKTVSSFANTYGGFIFIGIGEDEKTKLPVSFEGIPCDGDTLERVRSIVEGNVHPFPPTETFPILCDDSDNAIIVVRVFESFATPHICGNGVIYQRNGDASSPVRDRHDLDKLYEKGVTHRETRRRRLDSTITRRHIYGTCEWDKQRLANHLAISVLVLSEFIGAEYVLPSEIEQTTMLRRLLLPDQSIRCLRDGTASIRSTRPEDRKRGWNWWGAESIDIVYRDGMFEFIRQSEGTQIERIGSKELSEIIGRRCSAIGHWLSGRLRPGNQTHIEVHILGAWDRCFADEEFSRMSCHCDHGVICLEYDVDLMAGSALAKLSRRAINDVMAECGGVCQ